MKALVGTLGVSLLLVLVASSRAEDHVARSNYMILQQDETLPPPPGSQPQPPPDPESAPSPSDLPPARPKPSPADLVPEPPLPPAPLESSPLPAAATPSLAATGAGDAGHCGGCGTAACCCLGEPWKLPQPHGLQRMGIAVGGWIQHGITFNADHPADGFNGPVATNDLDREYQMNQLWMYLVRPVNTGGCGWDVGGRIDMMYGTDWRFGINHGLEDRINGFNGQTYGTVIPQAYLEVGYDDLSVKLGHFGAILDYETIPGPPNPFYSHSYSYGYTVPQLVTGVLADWKMSEQLSLQAGVHRGWMQFEDYNDDWDIMAGIKWESCDQRTSLAYALSSGRQSFQPVLPIDDDNRFVYSLVAQRQLTERLRYVLVHNLGYEKQSIFGTDAEWYGLNNYLLCKVNDCWAVNLRAEWLRDDDGVRIAGPGNIPGVRAFDGFGYVGSFYELTAGVTWRPHANVMFRPEVRYDWYDGPAGPAGLPFDSGSSDDQLLFGVDMVVTF